MKTMTRRGDEWLLRLLTAEGLLDEKRAGEVLESQGASVAGEILRRRLVPKEALARAVSARYGIEFRDPDSFAVDKMAVALVPESLCRRLVMVPLRFSGEDLEVLMANPIDESALQEIAAVSGRRTIPVFGLPEKIEELTAAGYGSDAAVFDLLKKLPQENDVECLDSDKEEQEDAATTLRVAQPVVKLANMIIAQAVRLKASDIHVEQEEKQTVVRYRIDGDLRAMMRVPKSVGDGPLVSRIKIMANLDVANRRRPQDGRAKLLVGKDEIGLRVSTIPTSFGEKAVLRILDKRVAEKPLESLGFRPDLLARLTALAGSNQGMMLITGPTGSGKTTTLYSALNHIKSELTNIVTVEDPIEYRLEGINQIQVNEKAGLTFAAALRSVLRQDPDVVLVGEIRDHETADIAFQAALTGHMVFSTLHTNDTLSTISRLVDMGVERFKMAPALLGITAQRLARRICPECRVEAPVNDELAGRLRAAGLPVRGFRGAGCERCSYTGLAGRVALTELLDLSDPAARQMLATPDGAARLAESARSRGWLLTMSDDALWQLSHGGVTAEEAAAYVAPAERASAAPVAPAAPTAPAPVSRRRVLIVDDNPDNRAVIIASMSMEDYELVEADGGAEAIKSVAEKRPDLILLDLMMPEIDGYTVLKKLRGDLGMTDIPVMVITAMTEAESQAQALEVGADDYMTKPFSPKILRARVKAMFRRAEA